MNLITEIHSKEMMRVVNLTTKHKRDDEYLHRLFSYLNKNVSLELDAISFIRKNVYKVKLKDNTSYILKGFPSLNKLKTQEYLTSLLKENGFPNTYSFYNFSKKNLSFESHHLGFMEYIPHGNNPFAFDSHKNIVEGIILLRSFHRASEHFVENFSDKLPIFPFIRKWEERLVQFKRNKNFLSAFIPTELLNNLVKWGEWSLLGIYKEKNNYWKYPAVILHGDVAHHNFIRSNENQLFLIDFDLISIGPELVDFLQYANRILPFLRWSMNDLFSLETLHSYYKEKLFLYALCYPSDIFREWNRIIREQTYVHPKKVNSIVDFTMNQMEKRQMFYEEVASFIK